MKALAIFIPSYVLFWTSFAGVVFVHSLLGKVFCSVANSIFIALLFIIAHDACHGSFAPYAWLNHLLGRLAFLPALYPFTSWELGHNRLHHCWTNNRHRDYAWAPLTWEEFQSLPPWQKRVQQIYRHPFGLGVYCLVEIWWRHMIFPSRGERSKMKAFPFQVDRLLVLLHAAFLTFLSVISCHGADRPIVFVLGFVIPQVIWLWLMGFVTYQQHTHPQVAWFDENGDWSFFSAQVEGTVRVIFPWPIGPLLHHVMEHTAHHVDPRIPLYNLPAAQAAIVAAYPDSVVESRFSFGELRRITAICQLYDYSKKCWLDFEGRQTTPPVLPAPTSASELALAGGSCS